MGGERRDPSDEPWVDLGSDVVQVGSDLPPRRPPRWALAVLAAFALVVGYAFVGGADPDDAGPEADASTPSPSPSSQPWQPAPPDDPAVRPTGPQPVVEDIGRALFDAQPGWEIVVRGTRELVRIQPEQGRVVRTPLPALDSGGPVSLVARSDGVVIRPWDSVPGYVVPDGAPARRLSERLSHGGAVFAGPQRSQVWVQRGRSLTLVGLDGTRTDVSVRLPANAWVFAADKRGNVLFHATGGVYVAGPEGVDRVTTGDLLAIGETRWLVVECDEHAHCSRVVVERGSGERRALGGSVTTGAFPGVISPDGSTAAFFAVNDDGTTLRLLDLDSGSVERFDASADRRNSLAWSPDGRWLFVASGGDLHVVDPRADTMREIRLDPRGVQQVEVRQTG